MGNFIKKYRKLLLTVGVISASIGLLAIIDKIMVLNHIYNFFGSVMLGLLLGGTFAGLIIFFCKLVSEGFQNPELTKKLKPIKIISSVVVVLVCCVVFFFWMGDFVKTVSDEKCFCNKPAIYGSHQSELGYCEEHKHYLLEDLKNRYTKDNFSGGGGSGSDYYERYDYDHNGDISQNEWEDALGDYMNSVMGD